MTRDASANALTRRAAISLIGAAGLAGCASPDRNILRVSFAPLQYAPVYEQIAKGFGQLHPGVRVQLEGAANYDDLLARTLRSALSGDVASVSHQGLGQISLLAERGLSVRLDPFMGDQTATVTTSGMDGLTRTPKGYFALPFAISTPVWVFNTDLVRQAGFDPDALPEGWEDLMRLGRAIRAKTGRAGLHFDYAGPNAFSYQALLFSAGGRFMDEALRTVELDSPIGAWALDQVRAFGLAGQVDMTREQASQAFTAGALGAFQCSSSSLDVFRNQAKGRFRLRMKAFPVTAANGHIPAGGNALVMLETDRAKQQLAWAYIRYARSPEAQRIMTRRTGYVPVDPSVIVEQKSRAQDPDDTIAIGQIPQLTPWFSFPGQNSIKITDLMRDDLQQVITLREDPAVVLPRMTERTNRLLESWWKSQSRV